MKNKSGKFLGIYEEAFSFIFLADKNIPPMTIPDAIAAMEPQKNDLFAYQRIQKFLDTVISS